MLRFAPLVAREQAGHGGDLAHLDRVSVETREDTVHAGNVAAVDELPPAFQIPLVRLPSHPVAETVEVVLDRRPPLLEAFAVQERREPPVQLP